MSHKSRKKAKGKKTKKAENTKQHDKKGSFYYSWHFWFLHALVLISLTLAYVVTDGEILATFFAGLLIYLIPASLYYFKAMASLENMTRFYLKTIKR